MQGHRITLANYRESARGLRADMRLHEEDLRWERDTGGIVVYATDNDVAKLYSDTRSVALGKHADRDDEHGYTRIFSGDEEQYVVGIGRLLSHFIYFRLGEAAGASSTRFLVPPLDVEFASILGGVFKNAGGESNHAQSYATPLDAIVKDETRSDVEVARYLIGNAKDILTVLIGKESKHAELLRLCQLINENRLKSLYEMDGSEDVLPKKFVDATQRQKSLLDLVWLSVLKDEWFRQLDKPDHDEKRRKNAEDDAEALANIHLINSRLVGTGIRFVMITGAPNILRVGRSIVVDEGHEQRKFSELWLRHPRCFLGDPDVLGVDSDSGASSDSNKLAALLDAFLAENETTRRDGELEESVGEGSESATVECLYAGEVLEFQKRWNELSAGLCLTHAEIIKDASYEEELVIDLVKKIRSADSSIKQFLMDAWHSAFLAASQTGFLFTWHLKKESRRNTPQLVFESFKGASTLIQDVLHQMQHMPGTEIVDFRRRIAEVRNDPSHGYTTYLVFGVLFAAQDHWQLTWSLADSSLRRIFVNPRLSLQAVKEDGERIITGREAFYLKAVAGRHIARSAQDLSKAHEAILLAMQVLDLEREFRGDELLAGDARFQYELCSINVAAAMFEKFMSDPGVFCGRQTVPEMRTSLSELLINLSDECCGSSFDRSCRERSRILTSLFIVEITLGADIGDLFPEALRVHLESFRAVFSGEHIGNPTMLTKVIFFVADWWAEAKLPAKDTKKTIALSAIDASVKKIQAGEGMPYEISRHSYLRNFVSV